MENGILPPDKYKEWSKTRIEYELENLHTIGHSIFEDHGELPEDLAVQIAHLENLLKEKENNESQ